MEMSHRNETAVKFFFTSSRPFEPFFTPPPPHTHTAISCSLRMFTSAPAGTKARVSPAPPRPRRRHRVLSRLAILVTLRGPTLFQTADDPSAQQPHPAAPAQPLSPAGAPSHGRRAPPVPGRTPRPTRMSARAREGSAPGGSQPAEDEQTGKPPVAWSAPGRGGRVGAPPMGSVAAERRAGRSTGRAVGPGPAAMGRCGT
jgi:hypothetical protein